MLGEWLSRKMIKLTRAAAVTSPTARMTKLATLRSQLAGLRRARAAVRSATAWSALVTAVLWALAGVFVLDVLFELAVAAAAGRAAPGGRRGRLGLLALYAAAAWASENPKSTWPCSSSGSSRSTATWSRRCSSNRPSAHRWGSPQLEGAVIDYVAAVGRGINVFEGFSREQMTRRGLRRWPSRLLTLVAVGGLFPGACGRLCQSAAAWARGTIRRARGIDQVVDHRRQVPCSARRQEHGQGRPASISNSCRRVGRCGFFVVSVEERLPAEAARRCRFQSRCGADRRRPGPTRRARSPPERDAPSVAKSSGRVRQIEKPAAAPSSPAKCRGSMDSVTYKVFLGDAWTDAARIEMIPLPIDRNAARRPCRRGMPSGPRRSSTRRAGRSRSWKAPPSI